MGKERVQTRVDPDTNNQIESFAEDNNLSQSEAIRRIIRTGLAEKGYNVAAADGGTPLERLASPKTVLLGVGFMLLATAALGGAITTTFTLPLVAVGTVLELLGVLTIWTAALAQLALARPLKGLVGLGTEEKT